MKPSMERLCVFCGKNPKSKNKEHIIPQWLIAHTGLQTRIGQFGHNIHTGKPRLFDYSSFVFPSCKKCNSIFSDLENTVKPVIISLLNSEPLSKYDMHYLLDWFDKIRIGLWLSFYFLDKNIGGIRPQFHIASRIGIHDRMLQIIKVDEGRSELSFRGCNMPSFYYTPSCFSLIINGYCFINISSPYLFSKAIGFPYPVDSRLREDGFVDYELNRGTGKIGSPLLEGWFQFEGTTVYQPMFRWQSQIPGYNNCYDEVYVRQNSLSFDYGIGEVFLERSAKVSIAPSDRSLVWLPLRAYTRASMNPQISTHTIRLQLNVDRLLPSYCHLDKKTVQRWDEILISNRKYGEAVISLLEQNFQSLASNKAIHTRDTYDPLHSFRR